MSQRIQKAELKIYIRCEANLNVGLGHLYRCIALHGMIEGLADIFFILSHESTVAESLLKENSLNYKFIQSEESFFNLLAKNDIVILDNYSFDNNYRNQLHNRSVKVVSITDYQYNIKNADVILNHSVGGNEEKFEVSEGTKIYTGLNYCLLRPIFLDRKQTIPKNNDSYDKVFICFGGADRHNLTLKTLKKIIEFRDFSQINIVVGSQYLFKNELTEYLRLKALTSKAKVFSSIGPEKIKDLIIESDFAIVPASSILLEVIALKRPFVFGHYVENQKLLYKYIKSFNVGVSLGSFLENGIEKEDLNFQNYDYDHNNQLIDGRSGERIREILKSLL